MIRMINSMHFMNSKFRAHHYTCKDTKCTMAISIKRRHVKGPSHNVWFNDEYKTAKCSLKPLQMHCAELQNAQWLLA
mgnify:FL=1